MNPEIIAHYFNQTPEEIRTYITSSAFDKAISDITVANTLPVTLFTKVKNVAFLIIIGAVDMGSAAQVLAQATGIDEEKAVQVMTSMDTVIFEYVRKLTKVEDPSIEVKTLRVEGSGGEQGTLRDNILSTYEYKPTGSSEKEEAAKKEDTSSRTALLEQLNLLGQIPNDATVVERLEGIKSQLDSAKQAEEDVLKKEQEERAKDRATRTYTQKTVRDYAIDPYREMV